MMNSAECEALLASHGIKPTANRIVVARTLAAAERPMSLTELEYKILSIDMMPITRCITIPVHLATLTLTQSTHMPYITVMLTMVCFMLQA